MNESKIIFNLDTKSGSPFYRQIINLIEYNVSVGKLKTGDKLPTIRQLAIELKVNPNTIAKAYNELEIRGLVNTQVGNGTFISDKKVDESKLEIQKKIEKICLKFLYDLKEFNIDKDEAINVLKKFKEDASV
ncbi:MAG TPA: GntR family transcriptional regulator [Spirochaetota bacterium]|nr:GntR family transcriptional regulator [Spirochaetota bacterium]